jgi:putative ABC transport system permease protein
MNHWVLIDKTLSSKLPILKQQLLQIPGISHVAVSSGNPISGNRIVRYDLEDKSFYTPYLFSGDEDLIKTLDLKLIEGELFSEGNKGCLVNEKLVRQFNFIHPIGEIIPGTKDRIIGVVRDFTCGSFKLDIPPVIISYRANANCLLVNFNGQVNSDLVSRIQATWNKVFPGRLFEYQVLQQDLMKKYSDDTFFYRLMIGFSITSLIISCFGLFAVSWAVIQSRVKEIGIRKIVGAKGVDILRLLSLVFFKRITIAFFISVPIAYYFMEKWLEHFVKRIQVSPLIFVASAIVTIVLSFVTLSIQLAKAIVTNPVDEIKAD